MLPRTQVLPTSFVFLAGLLAAFVCGCGVLPPPDTSSGAPCGGLQGLACDPGEFCNFSEAAQCGAADQTGSCELTPDACTLQYDPVCGCDDKTYSNTCAAHAAGVSVAARGECQRDVSCDRRELRCRRAEPPCPDMQVPEIVNGCYGACVPISACVCDEPEDCYSADQYTCHRYLGHCGPYVN